jgi:hypothetical protein
MRSLIRGVAFWLVFLNGAAGAAAADGAGQDGNSSPLLWIIMLLPACVIFVFLFFVIRKNQALAQSSLKRFDEHRAFSEAHMRRLESQIEQLEKRMVRMIELLELIVQAARREKS